MIDILYLAVNFLILIGIYDVCTILRRLVNLMDKLNKNILDTTGFVYNTDTKPVSIKDDIDDKESRDFIPNVNISNMK